LDPKSTDCEGGKFYQRFMFKEEYEKKELPFLKVVTAVLLVCVIICICLSYTIENFGGFHKALWLNLLALFFIELLWKSMLAYFAYRYAPIYKRTINYTRKFGNLMKLYKYFLADHVLPEMDKKPFTLIFIFCVDQLIYTLMFSHWVRK